MKAVFLYTTIPDAELEAQWRNYVNAAYMCAMSPDYPETDLDDREVIAGYRHALRVACERAKSETDADPLNVPKKFDHVLLIQSELVDVFGAAPGICQLVSLSFRAMLADLASSFRAFYGQQGGLEVRN